VGRSLAELTRGPGYDWDIFYQFEGEEMEQMSVFGQIKMEDALKEARYSLDTGSDVNLGTYSIYAIIRADFWNEE
jgi:hypothetical protein